MFVPSNAGNASFDRMAEPSIHNKKRRAFFRRRSVRLGAIAHVIAHARFQDHGPAVFQFRVELAFEAQDDVALLAPVIGNVARGVFNKADADIAELASAPVGDACVAWVFGSRDA